MQKKWATLLFGLGATVLLVIPMLSIILSQNQTNTPTPSPTVANNSPGVSPAVPSPIDPKQQLLDQERAYVAVLQREPNDPKMLEGLVQTRLQLIQLGSTNFKAVIDPLEKLAKLRPDNVEYRIMLGQAQAFDKQPEAAAQTYRSILATKPGEIKALQALVTLLMQQGRPEAAMGLLQDTLKMAPQANKLQPGSIDVFSVQLMLGDVYNGQGRFDEAFALFESLSKENPKDYRPLFGKGLVLQRQGKTQESKTMLLAAAELAPPQIKDVIRKQAGVTTPTSGTPSFPGNSPGGSPAPVSGTISPAPAIPAPSPSISLPAASPSPR
jgi:tetratricopeptide (TPR) repeat protein